MRAETLLKFPWWLLAALAAGAFFVARSADQWTSERDAGIADAMNRASAPVVQFNDLAVTANRLIAEGDAARILIVDLDVHQGDGTASLTAGREDIATFSMHAEKNFPVRKARSTRDVGLLDGTGDTAYLDVLAAHLPDLLDTVKPDIVLYQAGVDPHEGDRLGRLALTGDGLEARDRYVVAETRKRGLPIASALGGGYGEDPREVAGRHARSMLAMANENSRFTPL